MSNPFIDAFYSLGARINKVDGQQMAENKDGVVSERFPELTLETSDEELIKLTQEWKKSWETSPVYSEWFNDAQENENYWKGKQFDKPKADKRRSMVDNIIFESLETYLPQITRRNPEPAVTLAEGDGEDEARTKYANDLKKKLGEIADELNLRLKLKKAGRHWAIYLLGAVKMGWDMDRDIPTAKVIRVSKLILDPDSTVDEDGYNGKFIGEHRKMEASKLLAILENAKGTKKGIEKIKQITEKELGTMVQFIDWETNEYMCWTLGDTVLLKMKNPHWNYDTTTQETVVDEYGVETVQEKQVQGFNHLAVPSKPWVFLSVFNLGKQPLDDASLIGQNLSNQDLINKRIKQIDKNADSMNGGMVVSLSRSGLTQQQAAGVTEALRNGGTVAIPDGSPREAVDRFNADPLPPDVYNQLVDTRNRTREIFGTSGSTPAGTRGERTVRGKMIIQAQDTDRIGGGISEYLEQMADQIYNWFVQLLYVYDDTYAPLPGKPRVKISVKEGSLLPKDSLTIANQAIELASAGKMSTVDMFKRMDYPNPEELAANVWLEANAPEILYANDPRVAQAIQMRQEAAAAANAEPPKAPSMSISFKDLPPEGQAQLAAKVGIDLHPEAIAAYDANEAEKAKPPVMETMEAPVV